MLNSNVPDESITIDEMKDYGYDYAGMLPMREAVASNIMKLCTIYRIYDDNTEGAIDNEAELKQHAAHGGIFGIEENDWLALLKRKETL